MDITWCKDDIAANAAMELLRLLPGDVDEARVQRKARVACGLISQHLARTAPLDPLDPDTAVILDLLAEAHAQLTAELYMRKDAPYGVMNAYSEDGAFRIGSDPLAGIRHLMISGKERWGIA